MICSLGWHRWKGGVCASCGKTRHCSLERHFWKADRCQVCGSRRMGVAQIVTLVDKVVRKRFDKLHPEWIRELSDVGPIAIPYILREMTDLARSEGDLISPAFLDLRRILAAMGETGRWALKAVAREQESATDDRSRRVAGVVEEIQSQWSEANGCLESQRGGGASSENSE
jgi:hypothetical protein